MIVIKNTKMPKGCQHCMHFRKHIFGNGIDYSYSCMLGATEFPMPWIRQMEERASDCPLVEIVTCKDCKHCCHITDTPKVLLCEKHNCQQVSKNFCCKDGERRE